MIPAGGVLLGILLLCTMAAGCGGSGSPGDGDTALNPDVPTNQDRRTDASHPGWGNADCAGCHALEEQHEGLFTLFQCVECHGTNGAVPLDGGHAGWGIATAYDCWGCHEEVATPHAGSLAAGTCALCHGGNGAPSQGLGHFTAGGGRVRCASCHPEATTHGGRFEAADCGGCHEVVGAPHRPDPHYVIECVECHGGGAAPWDGDSHADTAPESPVGCALCHPLAV